MFNNLILEAQNNAVLWQVSVLFYTASIYTLLFHKSLIKQMSPSLKMSLVVTLALLAGMPPSPMFFVKVWNSFSAAHAGTAPVIILLSILNVFSTLTYMLVIKKCLKVAYSVNRQPCHKPAPIILTTTLLTTIVLFSYIV